MSDWFRDLPEDEREVVSRGWGSEEFADWTATFLLGAVGAALRRRLPSPERARLNRLLNQRMVQRHMPGHQPDAIERLHAHLHEQVAAVVCRIDDHTGKHGAAAVSWLDGELQSIKRNVLDLHDRLIGGGR